MKRLAAVLVLAAVAISSGGCAQLAARLYGLPRIAACDGPLPVPDNLRSDFDRRLRIHVESERVSEGFEIILQKRADRLTVVGLTRFGAKAFTIVQEGHRIDVQSAMSAIEAVPPRNVLGDLYHWPLGILATPGVTVEVTDDGRSARIANDRCGYRTTIVDTTDERH